jgi:AcrR family transcriptional regulator
MKASSARRNDPLTEILLTPTTASVMPAAARRRAAELGMTPRPTRAGAALARSRTALLDGARRAVTVSGTRISMAQVAAAAGVAKATIYNHFRTRDDVLSALLVAEIDRVISDLAHLELSQALIRAATEISEHPLLEALGGEDMATLAALSRVDVRSVGWIRVAEAVEAALYRNGRRGTPTVLRWLSSFVVAPADLSDIQADVEILIAGLPPLERG